MKKPAGCPRHLFTATAATARGDGGFRTVAHSPELSGLVDAVESLVDGYKAADESTPPCRQLLPVPGRSQIYAFTVFTPTGATADGRPGNYWAETLIVPADWLAAGGWDTAAAGERLEWWGPRDPAELADGFPAAVLPSLEPGPLDRLARLVEAVPESHLFALLLAVVQQSQGLRKIRLLERPGAAPQDLDDVVALLPLVVPPGLRTYRDDDGRRCLTWRSRSPRGAMAPAADLTGFPASAAGDFDGEGRGSAVFDLAGRLPPPEIGERFGEGYARWLHRTLVRGGWADLETLYGEEVSGPAAAWLAGFRRGEPSPASPEAPEEDDAVPIFAARRAAWKARDAAEGQAWALLESHRRQLETTLAELREELDEAARKTSLQWTRALESQRQALDVHAARSPAASPRPASAGRKLEARLAALENEVRKLRMPVGDAAPAGDRQERIALRAGPRWSGWLRRRDAAALIPKVALAALVVAGLLWGTTSLVRSVTDSGSVVETVDDPPIEAPPTLREQRRESLLQRLRDRDTAVLLLRKAAADEEYRSRVDAVVVALTLGRQTAVLDGAGRALLQQALEITVDGQWGPGSSRALENNLPVTCEPCAAADADGFFAWDGAAASCFLITYLQLDDPPCPGSSPWSAGRAWTEAEAANALRLIRAARASSTDPETAARIARLDPVRTPELWSDVPEPTLQQAGMLFDLAYALIDGDPRANAPDKLPADRLDQLGSLVDELGPAAGPPPAAREGAG